MHEDTKEGAKAFAFAPSFVSFFADYPNLRKNVYIKNLIQSLPLALLYFQTMGLSIKCKNFSQIYRNSV